MKPAPSKPASAPRLPPTSPCVSRVAWFFAFLEMWSNHRTDMPWAQVCSTKHSTFNIQPEKCVVGRSICLKTIGGIGVFLLFVVCQ
jgi:hypothetical protein